MGCISSKDISRISKSEEDSNSNSSTQDSYGSQVAWRQKETKKAAKEKFYIEGSIPSACSDELLELRMYLEEPDLLAKLGKYAMFKKCLDLLLCWADLLEFSATPEANGELQVSKALYIHKRYLSNSSDSVVVPFIVLPENYGATIMSQITACGPVSVGLVDDNDAEECLTVVDLTPSALSPALSPRKALSRRMFDQLQHECLKRINTELFVPFKKTAAYRKAMRQLNRYNHVRVDDFSYYGVLGCGTYGFVVRCKKRSTGVYYAMKIQTKAGLLDCHLSNPQRVTLEKDALASCHHPFIISMDYALQTSALVMMVMDIGTAGTLLDALKQCDKFQMPLDRVVFYTAEICLALMHIHRLGMIYRDLKPNNILLNSDGHIQLVDMGGVVDVGGQISGYHDSSEVMGGLFAQDYEDANKGESALPSPQGNGFFGSLSRKVVNSPSLFSQMSFMDNGHSPSRGSMLSSLNSYGGEFSPAARSPAVGLKSLGSFAFGRGGGGAGDNISKGPSAKIQIVQSMSGRHKPHPSTSYKMARAQSIMGSAGFMPPEMLILERQNADERKGYSCAADYWSLGVTVYKLLTGSMPFDETFSVAELFNTCDSSFCDIATTGRGNDTSIDSSVLPPEYCNFVERMKGMRTVPWYAINFVLGLLEPVEDLRLGCGPDGSKAVKFHKFFAGIPWHLLEQKQVTPPFLPEETNASSKNQINVVNTDKKEPQAASSSGDEPAYGSFSEMMKDLNLMEWSHPATKLISSEQAYFSTWDFVSPTVLKLEMGIAMEEEELLLNHAGEFESPQVSVHRRVNGDRKFSTGVSLTALGFELARSVSSNSSGDTTAGPSGFDSDAPQILGLINPPGTQAKSGVTTFATASPRVFTRGNSQEAAPTFRSGTGTAQNRSNSGGKILTLLSRLQQDSIEDAEREEFANPTEADELYNATFHPESAMSNSNSPYGTYNR